MVSICPHCKQELRFNEAQRIKIEKALAALQPGKVLKLGCPLCRKPIELESDADLRAEKERTGGGIMQDILYASGGGREAGDAPPPQPVQPPPDAPRPPDIGWLASGDFKAEDEWVEDVPTALLLLKKEPDRDTAAKAFQEMGYQIVIPESTADAIERMRFMNFSAVVYQVEYENGKLEDSFFHQHMQAMSMDRRRAIHYTLIGPDFHTFYDLEALANSANLVVNNREIGFMPVILKKGLHDYEELFNPLIMMLREYGRR